MIFSYQLAPIGSFLILNNKGLTERESWPDRQIVRGAIAAGTAKRNDVRGVTRGTGKCERVATLRECGRGLVGQNKWA